MTNGQGRRTTTQGRQSDKHHDVRDCGPQLTLRQRQVVALMAHGLTNKQIGRRLGISTTTASNHTTAIYSEMHVTNRTQAVMLSIALGLVDMDMYNAA